MFRTTYQMSKRPYVLGGLALGLGYTWGALKRAKRPVSGEFVRFHRQEQMQKLAAILKSLVTFKPIDNFEVMPIQTDVKKR